MSELTQYLAYTDLKYQGRHPKAVSNGMLGNGGRAWVRRSGGHLLYRGNSIAEIDWTIPVGSTAPTSATPRVIGNYPTYPFLPDTQYAFGLRAVGCGGMEERGVSNVTLFMTDGDGIPVPRVPNPPINLTAALRPNGVILLRWNYRPLNQEIPPTSWRVYRSDSGDPISYDTYLTSPGTSFIFDAIDAGYGSGDTLSFSVRSVSSFGDEEKNTNFVTIVIDTTPPDGLPAPEVTQSEEL